MSDKTFDLSPEPLDAGLSIRIDRDVDVASSPTLRQQLIELINRESPERLVVDLSRVGFMDSSGVATLVEALREQKSDGHKLVLHGLQPRVRGIFEISRLDALFTIVDDADAAAEV